MKKHLVRLAQTDKQRETLAVGAGFLSFEQMLAEVEGITRYEAPPNIDGWMIDLASNYLEVEFVKSQDGNCDTSTLVDDKGKRYGTYDKYVVGYIYGGPNGGTYYREVKLDVWNDELEDSDIDYILLEDMEETPEYVHEPEEEVVRWMVQEVNVTKEGSFEESIPSEGELIGDKLEVYSIDSSSFHLKGIVFEDNGDEVQTPDGLYGLYKNDTYKKMYVRLEGLD